MHVFSGTSKSDWHSNIFFPFCLLFLECPLPGYSHWSPRLEVFSTAILIVDTEISKQNFCCWIKYVKIFFQLGKDNLHQTLNSCHETDSPHLYLNYITTICPLLSYTQVPWTAGAKSQYLNKNYDEHPISKFSPKVTAISTLEECFPSRGP